MNVFRQIAAALNALFQEALHFNDFHGNQLKRITDLLQQLLKQETQNGLLLADILAELKQLNQVIPVASFDVTVDDPISQ